jgi:hypothetical protein
LSKPWKRKVKKALKRADVERHLARLEKEHVAAGGAPFLCFKKGCMGQVIAMDECLTCEGLGKAHRVHSCAEHRAAGVAAVKKHALVKHPANLLRVVAAGLRGEEI